MKRTVLNFFAVACMLAAPIFALESFAQNEQPAQTPIESVAVEPVAASPSEVAQVATGVAPASEVAAVAPAQTVIVKAQVPADVTDESFFASLASAIGSLQGLGTMGILALLIQLAVKFLSAPISGKTFKQLTGKTKITIIIVLSTLGSLVALVAQGMDWKAAALSGVGLAAISTMIQQIYVQYFGDKSEPLKS